MDQMTSFVFETFLGITHVDCLLCHNGRGHLDQLSLWGTETTRYQAWQMASYLSHTDLGAPGRPEQQQYLLLVAHDNPDRATDYALNTTTGNRPRASRLRAESRASRASTYHPSTSSTATRLSPAKNTARRLPAMSPTISSSPAPP